ncbi:outer membrane protein Omp31 [Afipia carboxidovorans OM5]|nr:outer membrane protein Omp31 [Afipia carboxidovorans OM5]
MVEPSIQRTILSFPSTRVRSACWPTGTHSGALGGFQIGYNYQVRPDWVIGLEGDFQLADIGGSGSTSHIVPGVATSASQTVRSFGTIRARLGHVAAENLLVYATGGFAFAKINSSARFDVEPGTSGSGIFDINGVRYTSLCGGPNPNVCYAGSSRGMAPGWTIGGGFEYALGPRWSLKGEYLYARFDRGLTEVAVTTMPGTLPITYPVKFATDLNIVRAGLNYRF